MENEIGEYTQADMLEMWLEELERGLVGTGEYIVAEHEPSEIDDIIQSIAKKHYDEDFCSILLEATEEELELEIMGIPTKDHYSLAIRVGDEVLEIHSCPTKPLPAVMSVVDLIVYARAFARAYRSLYDH